MKDEVLSAAQHAASEVATEREGLARELKDSEREPVQQRAGPKKVQEPVTDDVKVGKSPGGPRT